VEQFSFSINNSVAKSGVFSSIKRLYNQKMPVIVCIGTDAVSGDSLGPFVGTLLKQKNIPAFIYGHLDNPITAQNVSRLQGFIKKTHPDSKVLVIDSAVGKAEEVGLIKVTDSGIKPGLGADKDLPFVGDVSIMGIVESKGRATVERLKTTRLRLIWEMANIISEAICNYIDYKQIEEGNSYKSLTKIGRLLEKGKKAI
jgi:putative sporulation protein YyaC